MNKEVLFAQTLEQVRKTAKEQGNCISEEQVKEAFAELDLSNEQLQISSLAASTTCPPIGSQMPSHGCKAKLTN